MNIFLILLQIVFINIAFSQETSKEIQSQVIEQEGVQDQLIKEKSEATLDVQEATNSVNAAKLKIKSAETELERSLAKMISEIESYRAYLANIKLNKIKELESKINDMISKTNSLKEYENKIHSQPQKVTIEDLDNISTIWRNVVDNTLVHLFSSHPVELDNPPTFSTKINSDGEKLLSLKNKISTGLEEIKKEKVDVELNLSKLTRSQSDISFKLLLNAGRVRADALSILINKGVFSEWSFDPSYFLDFIREVQIVPYRLLATLTEKYYDLKSLSHMGVKGWSNIVKQIFLLIFVFYVPFLFLKLFQMFSAYLENLRKQIFTSSQIDFKKRTSFALWIGRLNPYLPWFFAYLTIQVSYKILTNTLLEPLTIFIPYLEIYVIYRAFLIFFSALLAKILLSKNLDKLRLKQSKLQLTASRLSILFFIEWAFLHAIEDAVRRALVYNLMFDLVVAINIIIVSYEARRWREELLDLSSNWLSDKLQNWLSNYSHFASDLILFPLLFLGNLTFLVVSWAYQWITRFEVGKKLSAELFKKRLEDAHEENGGSRGDLDESYKELFFNSEPLSETTRIRLGRSPLNKCIQIINNWMSGDITEDLILLYGNFGIGKSTILQALKKHFESQIIIKWVMPENKIFTKEQLYDYLSKIFETKIEHLEDIEKIDQLSQKTMVIIDDIHNFYLNTISGLEAYRALINITSLQLENIFWCFSCNERALAHLNGLFGKNHFVGSKIELLSWSDAEIQDLILKRHSLSKYKLKFDQIISAVHKGDILESSSGLEVQFFRLLWGQSRGNPRTAQELWLTAASLDYGNQLRVSVPEFTSPRSLADLNDDTLMIYAALVKHENLSFTQIVEVCPLPKSVIRQSLKLGEDGLILQKIENDRWRIHPKGQYVVHAQLIGRNFIYG